LRNFTTISQTFPRHALTTVHIVQYWATVIANCRAHDCASPPFTDIAELTGGLGEGKTRSEIAIRRRMTEIDQRAQSALRCTTDKLHAIEIQI